MIGLSRMGKLNVEAAERLGIYDSKRNDIKNGLSVQNNKGETVQPEQVVAITSTLCRAHSHFFLSRQLNLAKLSCCYNA